MFCRKCGKEIDYDAEFCKECQEMENFFAEPKPEPDFFGQDQPQVPVQPVVTGNRKEGFGKALTSTILSTIAYFVAMIAYGIIIAAMEEVDGGYYNAEVDHEALMMVVGLGVVFMLAALALAIPALIFGIKSIKCFCRAKREGRIKPIPTLVLGIIGVATSGLVFLFALLILMIATML